MPENVNCGVEQRRGREHRNPQQWIFKIYARRREIDDVGRQRLRKTSSPNQPATRSVDNQSRECADQQGLPCVTLQSDVNNNYERKVDVGERSPNLAQQKLKQYRHQ